MPVFSRDVRAMKITNEDVDSIEWTYVKKQISVFGTMNSRWLNEVPNVRSTVPRKLAVTKGIGRMHACAFHLQVIEVVKNEISQSYCLYMAAGESNWDVKVALVCFRYNLGMCNVNA